jgi:hypothetical protein
MNNEFFYQMFRKLLKLWIPMAFVTAIIVVIAGSLFKYDEIDFKNNAVSSTAGVVGFTEYGYPIFSYVIDGKEYKVRSRSQISNSAVGSKVEVKYHRENLSNVQIGENPLYQMAIPMIVFGSIGALVTGYFLVRRIFKTKSA